MKKIGIPGWRTGDNSFGVSTSYLQFISKHGKPEILMPSSEDFMYDIDLLILPGGMDVKPSYYGETPGYFTSHTDVYKQHFLENNLRNYIDAGIPVFGICLGLQQLNVFFGGSLEQDYRCGYSKERSDADEAITVNIQELSKRLGVNLKPEYFKGMKVNSLHHQAVTASKLAADLTTIARSDVYGNIEAVIHNKLKIAAVQWHPEELNRASGDRLTNIILNWMINND